MNAQEYIASGLLEAYVFGAASEAEAAEVERAISQYPEVAAEVAAIEETMFKVAKETAVDPPAHLQEEIWAKINAGNTLQQPVAAPQPAARQEEQVPAKTIPLNSQSNKYGWLRAAVWVGLIGSLAGNFMQYNGQKGMQQEYASLQQKSKYPQRRSGKE